MARHELTFRHPLTPYAHTYCLRCERFFDLTGFLAMPVCIRRGEWIEAALDYVQHAPELEP